MIDTIKIYAEITKDIFNKINDLSIIKTSYNKSNGEIFYEISNDHLDGSYDSKLSVRVGCGSKYRLCNTGYVIEIEGSYHKIILGYNSHNGYTDLLFIVDNLVKMVEMSYNIVLPSLDNWYLQRCDVAICYDLKNQKNVKSYINSLSRCKYPRRNAKFFYDESIYLSGTSSTLKIYNKLLEFRKHDIKKFLNTDFNIDTYEKEISGFIRFECEIKKKTLKRLFNNIEHIKVIDVSYDILKKVWSDEFMKIIKFVNNDLEIVKGREEVHARLLNLFKPSKANRLFAFYCAIQLNGENVVKDEFSKDIFYRNRKDLINAKIDFSQTYRVEEENIFLFNPFISVEVA